MEFNALRETRCSRPRFADLVRSTFMAAGLAFLVFLVFLTGGPFAGEARAAAPDEVSAFPINGLGLWLNSEHSSEALSVAKQEFDPARPGTLMVFLEVSDPADSYRSSSLKEAVTAWKELGAQVYIAPRTTHMNLAELDSWEEGLKALLAELGGTLSGAVIPVWPIMQERVDDPIGGSTRNEGSRGAWLELSYFIKRTAIEIRTSSPGHKVLLGPLQNSSGGMDLQRMLQEGVAAYLDALLIEPTSEGSCSPVRESAELLVAAEAPWLQVLALLDPLEYPHVQTSALLFREIACKGGPSVLAAKRQTNDLIRVAIRFARATDGDMALSYAEESSFSLRSLPSGTVVDLETLALFDEESLESVFVFRVQDPSSLSGAEKLELTFNSADFSRPILEEIVDGTRDFLADYRIDSENDRAIMTLSPSAGVRLLRYQKRVAAGPIPETLVADEVIAEEIYDVRNIIARHQAFQAYQDRRLHNYQAKGRIDQHFRVAELRTTFDITTENRFFFDRETGVEWAQDAFYINGVEWKSGKPPKLPIIQPEEVIEVPLTLELNEKYRYEFVKLAKVDGRECFEVRFEPVDPEADRLRGTVWIDRITYSRVRFDYTQTGLEAPVVSNTQSLRYSEIDTGTDRFWVLDEVHGEQILTIASRNTVVDQDTVFREYRINEESFQESRQEAYLSDLPMFRDTEAGTRALEKEDGQRVLKPATSTKIYTLAGGTFYDTSLDYPLPLLGLGYVNLNVGGEDRQFGYVAAGPLFTLTYSDPHLFGTNLTAGANAFAIAVPVADRIFRDGGDAEGEKLKTIPFFATFDLGIPLFEYGRLLVTPGIRYDGYMLHEDTAPGFKTPTDTVTGSVKMSFAFNRAGYSIKLTGSVHQRAKWEFWGRPGGEDYSTDHKSYMLYGATLSKDFFFPFFQKLHFDVGWFGGKDLDRFSAYGFGYFKNRVHGYSNSAIRAQEAYLFRTSYGFNLFELLRFEGYYDAVLAEDLESAERLYYPGVGVNATLLGPWRTVLTLDYGFALREVEEGRNGQVVSFGFIKTY